MSPVLAPVTLDFELDDVLNESVLEDDPSPSGSSSDSDAEVADGLQQAGGSTSKPSTPGGSAVADSSKKSALSDLSRWSRIPIGAFRSSTMHSRPAPQFPSPVDPTGRRSRDKSGSSVFHPAASAVLRGSRGAVTSLNHTLSSPGVNNANSKRAIERRMLTSPVFGPVVHSGIVPALSGAGASANGVATGEKRKGRKKDRKTPTTSRQNSPQGRQRQRSASTSNGGGSNTSLRLPTISPFVAAVGLPSESLPLY